MYLFCFGLGYVARTLSKTLTNWKISGTHCHENKLMSGEYLFTDGVDFNNDLLNDVTHILISIPPTVEGDIVYLRFADFFKTLKNLCWIGYFSSTSVYGDHQGAWVNEKSQTDPDDPLGKNRLTAEKQWLTSNLPVNILRLAGIYGPQRSCIETILAGKARRIVKENHYFSRVHVDDLVQMTKAVINNPNIGEVYNLADDFPSTQDEMILYACKLMKITPPPITKFEDAELSQEMRNYYTASKRVENSKIKNHYNLKLIYPSYKEGLLAIHK